MPTIWYHCYRCLIYYYRACITIVHIIASFILSLTRSLSDDPGFACPGWRSELSYYPIFLLDSHRRLIIETLHRYLCDLFLLSYLSLFFLSVMITNLFLQVFLYLITAGTLVYMEAIFSTEA